MTVGIVLLSYIISIFVSRFFAYVTNLVPYWNGVWNGIKAIWFLPVFNISITIVLCAIAWTGVLWKWLRFGDPIDNKLASWFRGDNW